MMHEIAGHPRSLNSGGGGLKNNNCSVKKIIFQTFGFRLIVHKSFNNLAYNMTCLIASHSRMLIFTFLKISEISWFNIISLDCCNYCGKGTMSLHGCKSYIFSFSLPAAFSSSPLGNDCVFK